MISEQTREKLSIATKNSYTDELREIRRQAMLRRYSNPNERELQSKRMKLALDNNITKTRMSEGQKERIHLPSSYAKMISMRKDRITTEETRKKIRLATLGNTSHLGHRHPPEAIEKMREIKLGKVASEETKMKMSKTGKQRWQDLEYKDKTIRKLMSAQYIRPNKPEVALLELLNIVTPNDWQYVGNGSLIVCGKNPDFWNGDHKLAELYGDYWHQGENPEERIQLFGKHGYKTLVIWEKELKEPEKVLSKIAEFSA